MMQVLRSQRFIVAVILIVVAAFIGTIFLVWGRGGKDQSQTPDAVAWVGDTPIRSWEREEYYRNLMQFYRSIYKNIPENELERRFKIHQSALDTLISRQVVLREARDLGFQVSPEEVRNRIMANSAFQENGRFSRERYLQAVSSINQTPEQFESAQREDLLIRKVEELVKEGVKVTDGEARDDYRRTREKVALEYVLVPFDAFAGRVTVTEGEVAERFEQKRQRYFVPERIQVEYVRFDPGAFTNAVSPSEAEVAEYYAQHSPEFAQPKMVRARHILFKLAVGASPEEEKKIRDRAALIQEKAKAGTDFAGLAKEFSQDASGPGGGDLGYFTREQMVPEFATAAFALPKGGSATWSRPSSATTSSRWRTSGRPAPRLWRRSGTRSSRG